MNFRGFFYVYPSPKILQTTLSPQYLANMTTLDTARAPTLDEYGQVIFLSLGHGARRSQKDSQNVNLLYPEWFIITIVTTCHL